MLFSSKIGCEFSEIVVELILKVRILLSECRTIDLATRERLLNDRSRVDVDFARICGFLYTTHSGTKRELGLSEL